MMIQAYAEYLEGLKVSDPKEYKRIIDDLQARSPGAMEHKLNTEGLHLPGGQKMKDGEVSEVQQEGIDITPDPGFVLKTTNTKSGSKVFINICTHPEIKDFSKKVQLMEDGTEQEGISVPMSVGPPKPDQDAAGKQCLVFDMIVNPHVIVDSKADKTGAFRHFLCQIAIQRVEGKYKTTLDQRYKLPKLKYKGERTSQRVRKESKPTIEEVDPEQASLDAARQRVKQKEEEKRRKLASIGPTQHATFSLHSRETLGGSQDGHQDGDGWSVHPIPGEGSVPNPCIRDPGMEESVPAQLMLVVNLPRLSTIYMVDDVEGDGSVQAERKAVKGKRGRETRVQVSLSAWFVMIRAHGYHNLEISLPFPVFQDCDVVFDQTERALKLRMTVDIESMDFDPVLPVNALPEDTPGPDPGSQQWLLAQALEDSYGSAPGAKVAATASGPSEDYPEDKFHLMPDNPDGKVPGETLPEDRFIKNDLISQHYLKQKEDGKRDKKKEYEQRREEQKDDPNITRIGYGGEDDPLEIQKKKKKNAVRNEIDKVAKRDVVGNVVLGDGSDEVGIQNDLIFDLLD